MADTEERLVHIESLLAHLQHDVETLTQTLIDHSHRLQAIDERFERAEQRLEMLSQSDESRDPDADKPPHY